MKAFTMVVAALLLFGCTEVTTTVSPSDLNVDVQVPGGSTGVGTDPGSGNGGSVPDSDGNRIVFLDEPGGNVVSSATVRVSKTTVRAVEVRDQFDQIVMANPTATVSASPTGLLNAFFEGSILIMEGPEQLPPEDSRVVQVFVTIGDLRATLPVTIVE